MAYVFMFLLGLVGGGFCVFLALMEKRRRMRDQKMKQDSQAKKIQAGLQATKDKQQKLDRWSSELKAQQEGIDSRVVSYKELQDESAILKRDLQNVDVNLRKMQLDGELRYQAQENLDRRSNELGARYLKENIKWIGSALTPNNFVACKQRLRDVIERCRGIGFDVSAEEEAALLADLKAAFEKAVRAAFEREEQARIKAQIREEQKQDIQAVREVNIWAFGQTQAPWGSGQAN